MKKVILGTLLVIFISSLGHTKGWDELSPGQKELRLSTIKLMYSCSNSPNQNHDLCNTKKAIVIKNVGKVNLDIAIKMANLCYNVCMEPDEVNTVVEELLR